MHQQRQAEPSAEDRDAARVEIREHRGPFGIRRTVVELSNRRIARSPVERFTLDRFRELCETAAYRLPREDGHYAVGRVVFTEPQWRAFHSRVRANRDRVAPFAAMAATA